MVPSQYNRYIAIIKKFDRSVYITLAELTNLNHPYHPRRLQQQYGTYFSSGDFLALYILFTKTTAAQNEVALSSHRVQGLYSLSVIFEATILFKSTPSSLYLDFSYDNNN